MEPSCALAYACRHRNRFVEELKEFVSFPSVSSQPAHAQDVQRCAEWLAGHLRRIGLEHAKVVATPGHPIVYADWQDVPGRPTVLVYGHYDVVPGGPLKEWKTRPFAPAVRGGDLYGRGASDDKGQMFAHVKALESCLETSGQLPVNVKCLFEGEEEIDSPHFEAFVKSNKRVLRADIAVMSDNQMLGRECPVINYGVRGNLRLELEVEGPKQDVHSGTFGGAIHNPLQALCEILASLHDENGRVAIKDFYKAVRPPAKGERAYLAQRGPSDKEMLRSAQVQQGWGDRDYSLYERTALRPALTLNSITGGSQGAGVKMIIPARALAKLSIRLVPDQEPEEIQHLFREHVRRVASSNVRCSVRVLSSARPALLDRGDPAMQAAALAFRQSFGSPPVFLRNGGTFPVVSMLRDVLGANTVLMGFALPDDKLHGPNEKFHLPNFYKGIATCIRFLNAVGAERSTARDEPEAEWSMAYGD